jgi:SAM-dependent methyltransferase
MSSVSGPADGIVGDGGSPEAQVADWASAAGSRVRGASSRAGLSAPLRAGLTAHPRAGLSDLFATSVRDYARQHPGEVVKILQAGCTGPAEDLGLERLHANWLQAAIRGIDEDHPLTREIAHANASGATGMSLVLGDLRTIPLPPRSFDVVYSAHLLDRIEHAELVLDRLVAALRPGGLLLLRFRDRQCAAALLDRILPAAARRAIWHWLRPRQNGPFAAVYEPLLSAEGVHAYVLARGLMIAERQTVRDRPRRPARPAWGAPLACRLIAALSRGRRPDDHDDLLYVIRKPENRFARVL